MRGVLGTAIVRVCGTVAAATGLTESQARAADVEARILYVPGASHAGYYPGASPIMLKLLYAPDDGALLGAQAVGGDGVDKRIDVLATAITARMSVEDLEHLDLCYAPPFGSAKDIVTIGGFAAANERRGIMPTITPRDLLERLAGDNGPAVLDVRTDREWRDGHLPQAIHVPLDELRTRLDEIPEGPLAVHCAGGYRSYIAQQILGSAGRKDVRNVVGGYGMIQRVQASRKGAAT
jgi:rhodanese-related sulfurtransferase